MMLAPYVQDSDVNPSGIVMVVTVMTMMMLELVVCFLLFSFLFSSLWLL